jgi:hypothetical protein
MINIILPLLKITVPILKITMGTTMIMNVIDTIPTLVHGLDQLYPLVPNKIQIMDWYNLEKHVFPYFFTFIFGTTIILIGFYELII